MKKILLTAFIIFAASQVFAQTALKVGEKAPLFTARDNSGKLIDLKKVLKEYKSVVLFFYRGQWCPFCSKHIKNLQDSLQVLTAKGAYVIGVSPENAAGIDQTVAKTKASFRSLVTVIMV